jgi:oxysterol-binding protein-related protein 8
MTIFRDGDSPEKLAEQIKAIFPIVHGQKPDPRHAIPPRAASSAVKSRPVEEKADDLIDFGAEDGHAEKDTKEQLQKPMEPTSLTNNSNSVKEKKEGNSIEDMLNSTGKPAPEGPLIDFHSEMKKAVPELEPSKSAQKVEDSLL